MRLVARGLAASAIFIGLLAFRVNSARAETSGRAFFEAIERLPDHGASFWTRAGARRFVTRVSSRADALQRGFVPITREWAVVAGSRDELSSWARSSSLDLRWAPPRDLYLNRADGHVSASLGRDEFGVSGQGVIVGVIDTGADVTHPALRNADGSTRIAWLLDFDSPPRGVHAALEEELECSEDAPCAVYSSDDLDALLEATAPANLPSDQVGHGTHVMTTAAGRDDDYPGIAPDARLIAVRAGGDSGSLGDGEILLGARFVFDRAAEMDVPAVINVSLGSSFGAHDGTSALERGLSELATGPGRVIVVAAGNDGSLYGGDLDNYPEPFGIHAEVSVPVDAEVRVPLLTPRALADSLTGAVYVWIADATGLSVGFDNGRGARTELVRSGQAGAAASSTWNDADAYDVIVLNGTDAGQDISVPRGSAVVAIAGAWAPGRVFDLVLSGQGLSESASPRVWVQSTGQLGPGFNGTGILVPRARSGGTVGIPASAPGLIAVGATTNRVSWTDYTGSRVTIDNRNIGDLSFFSSAGPNTRGAMKPDVTAPGEFLVAGMSSRADPRTSLTGNSQFRSTGPCENAETYCLVVDDEHGVSSGTSMSAPIVTGAVALLLSRDPELTLDEARSLLRGGAKPVSGETAYGSWVGAGALDIVGSLLAQDLAASSDEVVPDARSTRLSLASTFARPGEELEGFVLLRDAEELPAGGFDAKRLEFDVTGGRAKLDDIRAGVARFHVTAGAKNGGKTLTVRVLFDGDELVRESIPIGVDPATARFGFDAVGGSCGIVAPGRSRSGGVMAGFVALFALGWLTSRRRVA